MPDLAYEARIVSPLGAKIDEESSYTIDVARVASCIRSSSLVGLLPSPSSSSCNPVRSASRVRITQDLLRYKIPPASPKHTQAQDSHSITIHR